MSWNYICDIDVLTGHTSILKQCDDVSASQIPICTNNFIFCHWTDAFDDLY